MRGSRAFVVLVALLACALGYLYVKNRRGEISIGTLAKNAAHYADSTVVVRGTVVEARRPQVLFESVYGLVDGTDTVRILSRGAPPVIGEKLRVRGRARAFEMLGVIRVGPVVVEEKREKPGWP